MLALAVLAVVQLPQLGPLGARVPGAERVAKGEDALLGAGLLLVAAGATEDGVESVLLDPAQQGGGLEAVAARADPRVLDHAAGVDVVLDVGDEQLDTGLLDHAVAVVDDLVEVVAGVDVHERERHRRGPEGLAGEVEHHHRVLAAGEQHPRAFELCGYLAEDVDGLRLERVEMRERHRRPRRHATSSVVGWPADRTARQTDLSTFGRPDHPAPAPPGFPSRRGQSPPPRRNSDI